MMNGTIIRIFADKKFGFIKGEDEKEYFFHMTDVDGFFDDLAEDVLERRMTVKVMFEPTVSQKGPRAANVARVDL
jgi:cold shock CspA family protein